VANIARLAMARFGEQGDRLSRPTSPGGP
jgi:hypothetical protein